MTRRTPIPKPLGRPRDVNSNDTRARLRAAARQAFAVSGYDAASNKQIAEDAGITTGAIYHYYPSKADLYVAVMEEVQDVVYSTFEAAISGEATLVQRLGATFDAAVELNQRDSSLAGFIVNMPTEAQRHPDLAELLRPARAITVAFINRLVGDASRRGELPPGLDPGALADLVNAVLSGLARFSSQIDDPDRHAAAVGALKQVISGCLARPVASVLTGTGQPATMTP